MFIFFDWVKTLDMLIWEKKIQGYIFLNNKR